MLKATIYEKDAIRPTSYVVTGVDGENREVSKRTFESFVQANNVKVTTV